MNIVDITFGALVMSAVAYVFKWVRRLMRGTAAGAATAELLRDTKKAREGIDATRTEQDEIIDAVFDELAEKRKRLDAEADKIQATDDPQLLADLWNNKDGGGTA